MSQAPANAPQAPSSEKLLADAKVRAAMERKNVLVVFHASWCKWCKKLDEFMARPEFKPVFDANFVILRLTVYESADKLHLENPGAETFLAWLGGKEAGLPFFAILAPDGKPIANSLRQVDGQERGTNTGHPVAPEEVAHFIEMMKKGARKASPEQLDAMRAWLSSQKE